MATPPAAANGIYVGIIAFSNDAGDITIKKINGTEAGALLPLDTHRSKDALIKQFENSYRLSSSRGTSIYYALHKAIVNISDNIRAGGVLPKEIHSINIVVITDGYDNNSASPELTPLNPVNPAYRIAESQRQSGGAGYTEFFQRNVFVQQGIEGIPVTTWIFGIKDANTPEELPESEFDRLKIILNTNNATSAISDVENLQNDLSKILVNLDMLSDLTHVFAAMQALTNNAKVTIKIDESASVTGTVQFVNGKAYLINVQSSPPELLAASPSPSRFEYI